MAQAQVMANVWLERLSHYDSFADPDAAGQAGARVERFKTFARALRALWDLRKAPLAVLVKNVGGQVNVGEQQVNVAPQPAGADRGGYSNP
jgi:hypothetical protein